MCGRYTLTIDKSPVEKCFGGRFYIGEESYDWALTFNAAPSQMLPIIRTYARERVELARWGFWPEEWKRSARMRALINARLEAASATWPLSIEHLSRYPAPRLRLASPRFSRRVVDDRRSERSARRLRAREVTH
jgi:hypothetical protein